MPRNEYNDKMFPFLEKCCNELNLIANGLNFESLLDDSTVFFKIRMKEYEEKKV